MKPDPELPSAPTTTTRTAAGAAATVQLGRTRFVTELQVRPDDLDMFRHVHSSRYLDYVLAARFEQMATGYGMSMGEFLELGLAWYQRSAHVEFKRPLQMGDRFSVTTWIDAMTRDTVQVQFEIRRQDNGKISCDGSCQYTLVSLATGRAEPIPDWIVAKYAV